MQRVYIRNISFFEGSNLQPGSVHISWSYHYTSDSRRGIDSGPDLDNQAFLEFATANTLFLFIINQTKQHLANQFGVIVVDSEIILPAYIRGF